MTRSLIQSGLLASAAVSGLACNPDIPDPIWKGRYLHYGTTTSTPVCRGSFYRQEQHAVDLAKLLGFELTDVIHYTRVLKSEIGDYCNGLDVLGCAYVDRPYAFAVNSFQFHEMSHAVADLGGLLGPPPFTEGFAQVFTDGVDPVTKGVPIDDVIRSFKVDGANYYTAGLFTRFLIERHGLDLLVEFLAATDRDDSFAEFSPVFEQLFGEPIEQAMIDFAEYPACSEMSNRIAVVDCSLPLQPWDGKSVTLKANVSCDQDDVLGPTFEKNIMFTTRAFQVEAAAKHVLLTSAPEGWSGFRLVKCGSCWDSFDKVIQPGAMEFLDLSPGRYYVLFGRAADDPAELAFALGRF